MKKKISMSFNYYYNGEKLTSFFIFQGKKDNIINNEINKFIKDNKLNIITRT